MRMLLMMLVALWPVGAVLGYGVAKEAWRSHLWRRPMERFGATHELRCVAFGILFGPIGAVVLSVLRKLCGGHPFRVCYRISDEQYR
jgi:uncharacterized membrane protein YsdA (DUF1294 family)